MVIAPNTRDPVGSYGYFADNGDLFLKELTSSVATAGGFVAYDPAHIEAKGPIPRQMTPRHIDIKEDVLKKYHTIPMATDATSHWLVGGAITYGGVACKVISRIGESGKIGSRTPPGP